MHVVDLPEALPDRSRFLHIGMPKTGTTALQGALHLSREELERLGAHNVGRGRHEMKLALTAVGALPEYWDDRPRWEARWEELSADFRGSEARVTFWSSESLSQARPERIRRLADELGDDIHIVLTLRPLAPLMVSEWQEVLRRRGTEPLDVWLQKHFDSVTPEGEVRIDWTRRMPQLHRFSLRRVIAEWGAVFGEERLTFVMPTGDRLRNFRVFEALMGVPEVLTMPVLDNASLPYPEAEMLRHFNRAYTERGGDHPTWMFTMATLARVDLRDLTRTMTPHAIQAPRWAAERCNAYTEDWIAAIEDSDVNVVGDLSALMVDPQDFPETVDVPDRVDVETAGRLMEVGFAAAMAYGEKQRRELRTELGQYGGRELVREVGRRARTRLRGVARR